MQGIVLVYKDNITYILLLRSHPAFSGFSFTFDLTGIFLRYFILHFFSFSLLVFPRNSHMYLWLHLLCTHMLKTIQIYIYSPDFSLFFFLRQAVSVVARSTD